MKNFRSLILLLSLSICFFKVFAQHSGDHLRPAESIFSAYDYQLEYYSRVRKVLFKGFSEFSFVRFHIMPSFTPESVLSIERNMKEDKTYLIYHIGEKMIWYNDNWEKVKVRVYKRQIDEKSVEHIKPLWALALAQTKYPEERMDGLDGTSYYFYLHDDGPKTGMMWSPSDNTKMGKRVSIGNKLVDLARENHTPVKFDQEFIREIEALKKALE